VKGNDLKAESAAGIERGAEKVEDFSNKYIIPDL
jgi:hypothetical protein